MNKEAYVKGFKEELEKIAQLGLGGTPTCICPKCGNKQKHARGIPCNKTKCNKCGTMMVGEGMPHPTGKGGE